MRTTWWEIRIGRWNVWRWRVREDQTWRVWKGKTVGCYAWIIRVGGWNYELSHIAKD